MRSVRVARHVSTYQTIPRPRSAGSFMEEGPSGRHSTNAFQQSGSPMLRSRSQADNRQHSLSFRVTPFRALLSVCLLWGVWTGLSHMTHQPSLTLRIHMSTPSPGAAKRGSLAKPPAAVERVEMAAKKAAQQSVARKGLPAQQPAQQAPLHNPRVLGDLPYDGSFMSRDLADQQLGRDQMDPHDESDNDEEDRRQTGEKREGRLKSHKEAIQTAVWNRFRHAVHPSVDGGASRARLSRAYAFFNYTTIGDLPRRPIQCIGWKQTSDCSPHGAREPEHDLGCNDPIPHGASGYCNMWDKRFEPRGELKRVMLMSCDSHPNYALTSGNITCGQASEFAMFSQESVKYRPPNSLQENPSPPTGSPPTQGIVFCVAEGLMVSAYASIRLLREQGCELPVEIWYLPDELNATNPIAQELKELYSVEMRSIDMDRTKLCHGGGKEKCFNVKIHAVYHSRFDSILLLDTDNFVLRDPSYLFDTPEFIEHGAVFWPDFWQPNNTIFNVWNSSLVWELTGVEFVDMFEQESGQVLINRTRHAAALDVLMFYAIPNNIMWRYSPVYGDKDLFRLAWMRSESSFHMIHHPPGWAGQLKLTRFCGMTMVQHDPAGQPLFLHRNGYKLDRNAGSQIRIWDMLVDYDPTAGRDYFSYSWVPRKRYNMLVSLCYGPQHERIAYRWVRGDSLASLHSLEETILKFAANATKTLI
mmetsp:Transcript_17106/g.47745  ORF Transcript_17106/g.47745 Transcript_17106/m.47745 type:complete len:698 (-) Transcript_17106:291-2384(-)